LIAQSATPGKLRFGGKWIVWAKTGYFSIPFILASIFVAICFTDLAELIDKFKNS
jgi:hypothetical protein